jgi:hypothetical protein
MVRDGELELSGRMASGLRISAVDDHYISFPLILQQHQCQQQQTVSQSVLLFSRPIYIPCRSVLSNQSMQKRQLFYYYSSFFKSDYCMPSYLQVLLVCE